jgi:prepilin-type processing-associated H-X9-DG protein
MHFAAGNRSVRGLTVIEVLTVVFVLVVVAGLTLPVVNGAGHQHKIRCENNLKNIGLCLRIFAVDNNDRFPFEIQVTEGGTRELHAFGEPFHTFQALSNELSTPKILICPQDKQKRAAGDWSNFSDANLSYFLNLSVRSLDATNRDFVTATRGLERPKDWLAGDRNLTMNGMRAKAGRLAIATGHSAAFDNEIHGKRGNLLRADGSVEHLSGTQLLSETNHQSYLLLIP